jgi:hypothetical protein
MLFNYFNTRPGNARLRLWMVAFLTALLIGLVHVVVTESTGDAPIPSPNFKSEEHLGP